MVVHPPAAVPAGPRPAPSLAWTRPDFTHAHAVRIPDAMQGADQAERLAELLSRMEAGPAADFDIEPRTERRIMSRDHRPVVRVRLDGWLWFLSADDARLLARCIRAEPEALLKGANAGVADARCLSALPVLIAQALDRAARDAEATATARNALELSGVA